MKDMEKTKEQLVEELVELRQQQQLPELDQLYATSPLGLCLVDKDLRYVRINKKLADINGKSVDEHLGRNIRELVPELADQAEPMFLQVLESGNAIFDVEVHGTTPAEPEVERDWVVSYHPLTSADGSVVGVNAVVQDITERKMAERALQESEERFRQIFDYSHDGIFVIDPERDKILEANHAACHMLEYTREELLVLSISTIHPMEMDQLQTFADSVIKEGKAWTDKLTCTTKSGQVLPVEISASHILK